MFPAYIEPMNPARLIAQETRICMHCGGGAGPTNAYYQLQPGPEYRLVCCTCGAATYSPAEYQALLFTAEAKLRYLDLPLGALVGRVAAARRAVFEGAEQDALVSTEIVTEIEAALRSAVARVLDPLYFTPDLYNRVLRARCSAKQIYTNDWEA